MLLKLICYLVGFVSYKETLLYVSEIIHEEEDYSVHYNTTTLEGWTTPYLHGLTEHDIHRRLCWLKNGGSIYYIRSVLQELHEDGMIRALGFTSSGLPIYARL